MSQNGKWQNVVESLRNANVPPWLAQGIVEILDKAGYGLRRVTDGAVPMMQGAVDQGRQRYTLEEAIDIDIDKIFTRLCRRYDTQTADPSHCHRVAAYTYARLAVLQQSRPQSAALLLTQAQRVQ
jgi:hypothetical protein